MPEPHRCINPNNSNGGENVIEKTKKQLSEKEMMELLCAPEATDDIQDIDFDETDDDAAEQIFIQEWIDGELERNTPC